MPVDLANSPDLLPVSELLARSMRRVEVAFDRHLRSDLPPVQRLCQHIESYRGKMLRPMLVVLSGLAAADLRAGAINGSGSSTPDDAVSDEHIVIAAVCEMIHMATLVHDDVLDEADTRRKGATVNRLRGNEAAVILGDYLFSAAYHLCSTLDSQHAALLIGQTGMTLCAGELLQLHHRANFSIDEPTYFEIVRRKTASLISVACRLGAMQSAPGTGSHAVEQLAEYGLRLGVAFQIQDDLLDLLGNQSVVGKPLRKDLELGKLTLPVIHHLAHAEPAKRGETLRLLEDFESFDSAAATRLVGALRSTASLEYAESRARSLVDQAKAAIAPLPETPARRLLLMMADQVIARAF